jgi:RNA polymerase sigma-70 factor (ECF subfamily)
MALVELRAAAAAAGDQAAFSELSERYRRELHVHCYRLLGSLEEAEDVVQETFLRAWRSRSTFKGASTFRAWLYKIATNACLDVLRRRPRVSARRDGTRTVGEIPWLQPYPDRLLEEIPASDDEPDVAVIEKETMELAFIAAIQLLPPRQRVALIARDVLGWSAAESAELLDVSVASVNSALQRARATMKQNLPERRVEWAPQADPTGEERELLRRYMEATERGDATAMKELLREDAFFAMPPQPESYVGREAIVDAWVSGGFGAEWFGDLRTVLTRANGRPAVANYHRRPESSEFVPLALDVLRIEEGVVSEILAFDLGRRLLEALDLPPKL